MTRKKVIKEGIVKKTVVKPKKVLKSKKAVDAPSVPIANIPPRQYTIFYTIGNEPEFFIAHGTDYKLTTLDIKSTATADMFSFPVVFVVDTIVDTLDIIPMSSIGNIRYNWGFQAEANKYMTEFEAMQKKMKESVGESGETAGENVETVVKPKKKSTPHDVQYV